MNVNVSTSKKSGSGSGGSGTLSGCFSIACCTIKWQLSGANYEIAIVQVFLNNEGIGAFQFGPNLQNWSVPPSQVGTCQLNSCLIQGQTATPGGQIGSLLVQSFSLDEAGVTYTIQSEILESWMNNGTVLQNNSNC